MDDAQLTSTALVTLNPEQYVQETFAPFSVALKQATTEVATITYDVTTKEGLEVAKSCRKRFSSIRIDAEKIRKERKDPIIKIGKLLDAHYQAIEAEAIKHEQVHDEKIKAEEARLEAIKLEKIRAEEARKASIAKALATITDAPANAIGLKAEQVLEVLEQIKATEITNEIFGERDVEAENAKYKAIEALNQLYESKLAQETFAKQEQERQAEHAKAEAEAKRIDAIKTKLLLLENSIAQAALLDTSVDVQLIIDNVNNTIIDDTYGEFKAKAEETKHKVLTALQRTLKMVQQEEQSAKAQTEAQQAINEAKPQVVEREAVTLSSQDQVSEPASSLTLFDTQFSQVFQPSADEIVSSVAKAWNVDKGTAHKWLCETDFVMLMVA